MASPKKRVAVYVRVSTQDQSCELQKEDLLPYIEARGWTLVGVHEDKATGTNANRPALQEALKQARERRFDVLLVWKMDRLARSLRDLVITLHELSDLGVDFISLKDNIDMTTAAGKLMAHLLGAFAEFEASLIRERVKAGLVSARARGAQIGRPKLRDDEAIRNLRKEGLSIRAIARKVGVSPTSVQRALGVTKSPSKKED